MDLAKYLQLKLQNWFLKFIGDALDVGFHVVEENEDAWSYSPLACISHLMKFCESVN